MSPRKKNKGNQQESFDFEESEGENVPDQENLGEAGNGKLLSPSLTRTGSLSTLLTSFLTVQFLLSKTGSNLFSVEFSMHLKSWMTAGTTKWQTSSGTPCGTTHMGTQASILQW
jgi:hypothetical protein